MSFLESSMGAALVLVASLPAAACTQRVEYPLSVEEAHAVSIHTEIGGFEIGDDVRYKATRVVDEAMKADLEASAAAGCRQTVRGPDAYGSVTAEGFAYASYGISSDLYFRRPSNEKFRGLSHWSDDLKMDRLSPGTLSQTHKHKEANSQRMAGWAQVGDVLEFFTGGRVTAGAGAGVAAASYHWGDAALAPVITIWRP